MSIIAYIYEAGMHCPDCAARRFPLPSSKPMDTAVRVNTEARDMNDNCPRPVHSTDLFSTAGCHTCHARIPKEPLTQ